MIPSGDHFWHRCAAAVAGIGILKGAIGVGFLLTGTGSSHEPAQIAFTFVLVASLLASCALYLTSPVLAALLALAAAAYAGGYIGEFWAYELLPIEIFLPAMLWLLASRADPTSKLRRFRLPVLGLCLALFILSVAGQIEQFVIYAALAVLSVPALTSCLRLRRFLSIDRRLRALLLAFLLPLAFLLLQVLLAFPVLSGILGTAPDPYAFGAVINVIAGLGAINVARVAWQEREAEMQAKQRIQSAHDFVEWGLGVFTEEVERHQLAVSEDAARAFREIYAESGAKAARTPRAFVLVEEQLTKVMVQQASMAVMAARWKGNEEIAEQDMRRAILGHQIVKPGTWLCPPRDLVGTISDEEAA